MTEKVLFVDDEKNVLSGFQRKLRKQFQLDTALGGPEGLAKIKDQGPYSVVVSDMRMPVMDGIQFLSQVREIAPNSVRMVLTGYADLKTTIESVNETGIFRFLTKPCPDDSLNQAIQDGIEQYRLVVSEKELLEKTLKGSIKVLTEVLSLVNPDAFGRSSRIKRYAQEIATIMNVPDVWLIETAAMLSQIGCVILHEDTLRKLRNGRTFTDEEKHLFSKHPSIGSELLSHIPRMEEIRKNVAYQQKNYDGSGVPKDTVKGDKIPVGARILKVVLDFDMLESVNIRKKDAIYHLEQKKGWYDPKVLEALKQLIKNETDGDKKTVYEDRQVNVKDLRVNMILGEDIYTSKGLLLIPRGQEISHPIIERLKNFSKFTEIKEPIYVRVPIA